MGTPDRPTIRDVAAAGGVSVTTVSDVVNEKGRVDPATRARIGALVAEMGYRPRRSARALRSGKTGILAMCLPVEGRNTSDWLLRGEYDMALVAGCAAAAVDSGYQLLLTPHPSSAEELTRLEVDGVLVMNPEREDRSVHLVRQAGIPLVTIDRDPTQDDGWWTTVDTKRGVELLAAHLVERGARSIGLLWTEVPWSWYVESLSAFSRWCEVHAVDFRVLAVEPDNARASAAVVTATEAEAGRLPEGLIALSRDAALGVLDWCSRTDYAVPGRLRLVSGVDGHDLGAAAIAVTALDLRPIDTAMAAVHLLIERVRLGQGAHDRDPVLVEPTLIVRASS